tara:strand:- start:20 stop:958 length:939 start_codon:yes stop_codon:yes gene_type:complete
MEKELKQIIEFFLSFNKIIFNKEELHLQLLTHPYFPSINAITDLFDHFKIENVAAELPKEVSVISELPDTFLAHIKEENSEKIVLVVKKGDELKLVYDAKTTKNLSYKDFVALWTGVVVAIEKNENIVRNNSNSKSILKSFVIGVFALVIFGTFILYPLSSVGYGYLLISIIGFYISVLLVQKELGLHSKSLDKFCEASENNSCDDVLNSKGATIFGVFKLSDVGIVYFSGIILSIFLFSLTASETSIQLFYNLSVLSLLFIPYSIYYQWRVIKKWCPLCIIVIGVLLIQGLIVLFFANISFVFNNPLCIMI